MLLNRTHLVEQLMQSQMLRSQIHQLMGRTCSGFDAEAQGQHTPMGYSIASVTEHKRYETSVDVL